LNGPGGSRTLEPPPDLPHLPLRRGCFAELSAIRPIDPGQGIESGLRPVLTGVLPIRRSRSEESPHGLSVHLLREEIDAAGRRRVGHKAKPCFPCHSPTLRPWITDAQLASHMRLASYVEELWSPSLACSPKKEQAKANAYQPALFLGANVEGLSLSGGASIRASAFQ
jgi:hypothetical protein